MTVDKIFLSAQVIYRQRDQEMLFFSASKGGGSHTLIFLKDSFWRHNEFNLFNSSYLRSMFQALQCKNRLQGLGFIVFEA